MARPVTAARLLQKTLRLINRHLGQLNEKLAAGEGLSGPESAALASYVSTLRATVKQENQQKKERSASTSAMTNEELARRASEVLNRKNTTSEAPTAPKPQEQTNGTEEE